MIYNNSILIIDPAFDQSLALACNLLVKIGRDSFSYAIINDTTKQLSAVFDEQECDNSLSKLIERFKTDSYLNFIYRETKVSVFTDEEINVPNDFFDNHSIELHSQLFEKNHSLNICNQIFFGFTTVFGLDKSLKNLIDKQFANLKIYPQHAGLLTLAENFEATHLFLDFSATSFSAIYVKEKQVVFQKNYEILNVEEFNYYILLIIDQLKLQTSAIEVHLSGIIELDDHKYLCLQQYFDKIGFNTFKTDLMLKVLEDMPAHYYTNLLTLTQCV